ncbi:haloacid dehalogenase [Lyophyllum atratum]|nr:haloacid dehalogenase [Lyophyllum atratum]
MALKLEGIDAFIFDIFGTVVDWRSSVEQELASLSTKYNLGPETTGAEWQKDFAQEWRTGYIQTTAAIAGGAQGTSNVDVMHREILDRMLDSPGTRWAFLAPLLDDAARAELNGVWHRLRGWPDSSPGLHELKKHTIIATLSNGNVRLLVDMAKYANLPWDVVFSTELFDTFKPNPKAYLSVARHLSAPPSRCVMVAAHIFDLRAAGALGMRTVYIPRPNEDFSAGPDPVKTKAEGGEVDIIVSSLEELAGLLTGAQGGGGSGRG